MTTLPRLEYPDRGLAYYYVLVQWVWIRLEVPSETAPEVQVQVQLWYHLSLCLTQDDPLEFHVSLSAMGLHRGFALAFGLRL